MLELGSLLFDPSPAMEAPARVTTPTPTARGGGGATGVGSKWRDVLAASTRESAPGHQEGVRDCSVLAAGIAALEAKIHEALCRQSVRRRRRSFSSRGDSRPHQHQHQLQHHDHCEDEQRWRHALARHERVMMKYVRELLEVAFRGRGEQIGHQTDGHQKVHWNEKQLMRDSGADELYGEVLVQGLYNP